MLWYSPSEMVCPHEKYSPKIGDYLFFPSNESSQIIQESGFYFFIFYFNVFILKCYGLALAYENSAPLPADIPTLTSPIVPQLWLIDII